MLLNVDVFQFCRPLLCFIFRGQCAGVSDGVSQTISIAHAPRRDLVE